MKRNNEMRFTLIELIISIVIIGMLAAIVVPNIGGFKKESTTAAMQANIKNIETAVTMYSLDNHGKLPIEGEAVLGIPQVLDLKKLHPDHIRKVDKNPEMKYWLDYTNTVWASSADSPTGVFYSLEGELSWDEVKNAQFYNVYSTDTSFKLSGKAANKSLTFVQKAEQNKLTLPEPEEGEFYLISSVDVFGLESPPTSTGYEGYKEFVPPFHKDSIGLGESHKEPFNWPLEMEKPRWITAGPEVIDGNYNTSGSYSPFLEWEGDMSNRVIEFTYTTIYATEPSKKKTIEFLDADGKSIPFVNADTDAYYNPFYASLGPTQTKTKSRFVVPRGAVKVRISGDMTFTLYEVEFVKDLSLPPPVSNVKSETNSETIVLTWDEPTSANYDKAAVYANNKFIGYGLDGTFTHPSPYSDMKYDYYIEPVSVVGNRGQRVYHSNKTEPKEINWRGLSDAKAFDNSSSTYTSVDDGSEVSWIGDLANRQITILHSGSYDYGDFSMSFYNDDNVLIPSKLANSNALIREHVVSSNKGVRSVAFVVPEGATKFRITKSYYSLRLYTVSQASSLTLPSELNNVESTSTTETVTLTFNRPADVSRVGIFRNGMFLAYVTEDSYVDSSLYSDTVYTYTFETFNSFGNRTAVSKSHMVKTKSKVINWSGLADAKAFDNSLSTYASVKKGDEVSWKGDLKDRQITIRHSGSYNYGDFSMAFYNDENVLIPSKLANSNALYSEHSVSSVTSVRNVSFLVPAGATKFRITKSSYSLRLYDVSHGSILTLPSELSNVESTSTTETLTLQFNKPEDVSRVGIFRNNIFLAYTTEDTYTDTSLYSDKEYTYTFETFNSAGNRTAVTTPHIAKTQRAAIVFRGLVDAFAFDSSMTTSTKTARGDEISWTGDTDGKTLTIRHTNIASPGNFKFSLYNASNVVLATHLVSSNPSVTTSTFTLPVGAVKFRIVDTSFQTTFRDFSIN